MTAILHTIAVEVADLINQAPLSLPVGATVRYNARAELETLNEARIDVVPAELLSANASRITLEHAVGIDVVVRYRFGTISHDAVYTGDIEAVDIALWVEMLEQIAAWLADPANRSLTSAAWVRNEIRLPWVPAHLLEHRQYTGILRAFYQAEEDLA